MKLSKEDWDNLIEVINKYGADQEDDYHQLIIRIIEERLRAFDSEFVENIEQHREKYLYPRYGL